jgi:hypothetical protein
MVACLTTAGARGLVAMAHGYTQRSDPRPALMKINGKYSIADHLLIFTLQFIRTGLREHCDAR